MKKIVLPLTVMFLLSPFAKILAEPQPASTVPPVPAPGKRKPIVMKWETMGGIRYYFSGIQIKDRESLEHVIGPLNDPAANQLLVDAKHSQDASVFWLISGGVAMIGGLVMIGVDANVVNKTDQVDGQEIVGGVIACLGLVGDYVGLFKMIDAKADEFEAIQRYNAVVHGDDLESFRPVPRNGVHADLLTFKF